MKQGEAKRDFTVVRTWLLTNPTHSPKIKDPCLIYVVPRRGDSYKGATENSHSDKTLELPSNSLSPTRFCVQQ